MMLPAAEMASSRLTRLQRVLERIYEVQVAHDVDDFLITDSTLARQIDASENARDIEEKLLVLQDGDNVDLALYVDQAIVDCLTEDDPVEQLHEDNLVAFCTALEGVSHFLYLIWNAAFDRRITQLELEMQAEVDKYVTIATLVAAQQRGRVPPRLHAWLFDNPSFDPVLSGDELVRYRDANHYAGKYCFQLENRYLRPREGYSGEMLSDLRRFYRLTLRDKIRCIETAA